MDSREENFLVINRRNEVIDGVAYARYNTLGDNDISDNPYPVFYIGKKPVYEGDYIICAGHGIWLAGRSQETPVWTARVVYSMRSLVKLSGNHFVDNKFLNIRKAEKYLKTLPK